jgi:hypothetical protein
VAPDESAKLPCGGWFLTAVVDCGYAVMDPDPETPRSRSRFSRLKVGAWLSVASCIFLSAACSDLDSHPIAGLSGGDEDAGGGIGGTGIIGVVTEIGSIVVNGINVEVAPDTPVRRDAERAAADDLRLGQVVMIQAAGHHDTPVSQMIDIRREVVGPVTDLRLAEGRISVMRQPVVLDERALINIEPEPNLMVAVSGFRLIDRTIVATRIDGVPSSARAHLYGRYRGSEEGVEIDGVMIEGMAVSPDLAGREVLVKGEWAGDKLKPVRFEVQPAVPFSGLNRNLSIAGFFDSYTNTLSDTRVDKASEPDDHVHLSDGREVFFGIFEGNWSPERSALEIDAQFSVNSLMATPNRAAVDKSVP